MFKNLIFDWSGTLVDDMGPVLEATNVVLEKYGIAPYDREGFRRNFRLPYRESPEELLPGVALEDSSTLPPCLRWSYQPRDSPSPCTREAGMGKGKGAAYVCPHLYGRRCVCKGSWMSSAWNFFEATYAGVLDKRELITHLLDSHGLEKTETAFVGDMTHDVETAKHGGISSIAVLTGYHHAEVLATVRPDITVPDLGVLVQMLDKKG